MARRQVTQPIQLTIDHKIKCIIARHGVTIIQSTDDNRLLRLIRTDYKDTTDNDVQLIASQLRSLTKDVIMPSDTKPASIVKPNNNGSNFKRGNKKWLINNSEKLIDELLELKRANPKKKWKDIATEMGLPIQGDQKLRKLPYFASQVSETEQKWVL